MNSSRLISNNKSREYKILLCTNKTHHLYDNWWRNQKESRKMSMMANYPRFDRSLRMRAMGTRLWERTPKNGISSRVSFRYDFWCILRRNRIHGEYDTSLTVFWTLLSCTQVITIHKRSLSPTGLNRINLLTHYPSLRSYLSKPPNSPKYLINTTIYQSLMNRTHDQLYRAYALIQNPDQ